MLLRKFAYGVKIEWHKEIIVMCDDGIVISQEIVHFKKETY